jgi:hypothetical protein
MVSGTRVERGIRRERGGRRGRRRMGMLASTGSVPKGGWRVGKGKQGGRRKEGRRGTEVLGLKISSFPEIISSMARTVLVLPINL